MKNQTASSFARNTLRQAIETGLTEKQIKADLSARAYALTSNLSKMDHEIAHHEALELIAHEEGFANYQSLLGCIKKYAKEERTNEEPSKELGERALAEKDSAENDYILKKGHTSAWIEVDEQLIYIHRTDEGVIVDMFAAGTALDEALASTYLFSAEALATLIEEDREQQQTWTLAKLRDLAASIGACVSEDSDQSGMWTWHIEQIGEGCESSFDSERHALYDVLERNYIDLFRNRGN